MQGGEGVHTLCYGRAGAGRLRAAVVPVLVLLAAAGALSVAQPSRATADPSELERAFTAVVEQVAPSVVALRGYRARASSAASTDPRAGEVFRIAINGAGTIISSDGLILTNEHVIQDCEQLRAVLHDGTELPATVVAADPRGDLAVLRVPRTGLRAAGLCDWSTVARGQWSLALGNPYGLGADGRACVAVGIVANLDRAIPGLGADDDRFYYDMIQTTAAIHPGHSGGPLFNLAGELIGVITAMHTHAPTDQGVAFAIPLTPARRQIIHTLAAGRLPSYGYLGLTVRALEPAERIDDRRGVIVQEVEPGGPAELAGVRIGDRILAFDDQVVSGPGHLAQLVGQASAGNRALLAVVRGQRALALPVEIGLREPGRTAWLRDRSVLWRGVRVVDVPASEGGTRRGLTGVRVVDVVNGSPAQQSGLVVGDIVAAIDSDGVPDTATFLLRAYATRGRATLRLADGRVVDIAP
ncbi:MAG: trypsin-like peptidase domain-containing protein [Phycisphaerales bacterium]|nr:trypsin-like peptidase domain-containing protein [Phycisphaerales bacterium]